MAFLFVQSLDGFGNTADNANRLLPKYFRATVFEEVQETAQYTMIVATSLCTRHETFMKHSRMIVSENTQT